MCTCGIKLSSDAKDWIWETNEDIRKGMVLIDRTAKPIASWGFEAEVWAFDGNDKTLSNSF